MENPKILIVDDDPDLSRGLKLRLHANHYATCHASDGYSAIAVAQKERGGRVHHETRDIDASGKHRGGIGDVRGRDRRRGGLGTAGRREPGEGGGCRGLLHR